MWYTHRIHRKHHTVGIADDTVRTMRINGRRCMTFFYTRPIKIRCVRCGPVDAYLNMPFRDIYDL
ncbi:hypothetical protein SFRURICE_017729 [Spodoptera frugiperda]|uniref:SFRICE_040826 n=1 Tax=Spodoptera frugiperda TaxID=7108 RepID=A0A2H1X1X8_SPOFR|nr:hypothetical protein SFRURICE_017729 [Spodoptera frugiperda]